MGDPTLRHARVLPARRDSPPEGLPKGSIVAEPVDRMRLSGRVAA